MQGEIAATEKWLKRDSKLRQERKEREKKTKDWERRMGGVQHIWYNEREVSKTAEAKRKVCSPPLVAATEVADELTSEQSFSTRCSTSTDFSFAVSDFPPL